MDANELTYFDTIKTAHGDGEAAFCIFFFFQGSLLLTKISYNVLLYVLSLSLEYQCIAGKIGLYCLIFLRI